MQYRNFVLAGAVAAALAAGMAGAALSHDTGGRRMGPGIGMGQGMMGGGMMGHHGHHHHGMMGHGMMGQGMMGHGMMGPGMMGPGMMMPGMMGPGMRADADRDLSVDDVRGMVERHLAWRGNKRLKLGEVNAKDDDTFTADIVTVDDSLVQRFEIDRHSGFMRRMF